MSSKNPLIMLLSGAPGTGKSTIQRHTPAYYRPLLGDTAAFGTDEVLSMIDPN